MKRRDLIAAIFGTVALSQLPRAIAAPKYPRGQTPFLVHYDDAALQPAFDLGEADFTVEFWMTPDFTSKIWDAVALTKRGEQLCGYINGCVERAGEGTLEDYRFYGAALLGQVANGGNVAAVLEQFYTHMQQHIADGALNNVVVRKSAYDKASRTTFHYDVTHSQFLQEGVKPFGGDPVSRAVIAAPLSGLLMA